MFSRETVEQFRSRFRELNEDRFQSALAWVERKDAAEVLDNPAALLHTVLTKALEEQRANPKAIAPSQAGCGSLRENGSWDRSLVFASPTERLIRAFADECARKLLPPSQAAVIADASPQLDSALGNRADWPSLTADALAAPGHDHDRTAWVEAAWRAAHTSTSAAEALKRRILAALSRETAA